MQLNFCFPSVFATFLLGSILSVQASSNTTGKLVYTFRKQDGTDFFMTTDEQEAKSIGMNFGPQKDGYIYLGAPFRLEDSPKTKDWIPLYRYYNGVHFYASDTSEIGVTKSR